MRAVAAVALFLVAIACGRVSGAVGDAAPRSATLPALDSARLIGDLFRLAHDSMAGRGVGTPENAKARAWLVSEFRRIGLDVVGGRHEHGFVRPPRRNSTDSLRGTNVLGSVRGRVTPGRVLVVSAHYDHVGTRNGEIHNGADDNASGTAAVLAMAAYFKAHPPSHTIIFALWDAEESGLQGARAFVAAPPVPLASIAANVNLDMVGRNDKGELYAAGATPWPQMRPLFEGLGPQAAVTLRLGHDSGGGQDDWTNQSDQGAFNAAGVPFVYFGVEDHPDYHRPTDDPERIQPGFFHRAARTIAGFVERLDGAVASWPGR
jgi:Zn-dependent M28 family amino/carboxypeptidase